MRIALVAVAYLACLFGLAALVLLTRDRIEKLIWKFKNPPEKVAAQRKQYINRLQSPDWSLYQTHLQRSVPNALKEMFLTPAAVGEAYYFSDLYVTLAPIDRLALEERWPLPDILPFAESDGDPIFIKPGAMTPDTVFIAFHDGGDIDELAPNVETFLSGLQIAD